MSFYQTPQWRILFFVFLSMALAVFYHQWKNQKISLFQASSGQMAFASLSDEKNNREIQNCQCVRPGQESSGLLHLENRDQCSHADLDVSAWPPLYRLERSKKPAEFPSLCLLPGLKKWGGDSQSCLRTENLNVVYNFFGDLTECLDLPQKEFLNVYSSLSKPSALDMESWNQAKQKIVSSTEPDCLRVQSILNLVESDVDLKFLTVQAWYFQNTLQEVRHRAQQTNISGSLPEQWEEWVLARSLEVGAAQAFMDIQNSSVVSSRKLASSNSEKAQDLVNKWSQTSYLQSLITTRQNFDGLFKEGTCVPESFLRY